MEDISLEEGERNGENKENYLKKENAAKSINSLR